MAAQRSKVNCRKNKLRRNAREFNKRSNPNGRRTQKSALERVQREAKSEEKKEEKKERTKQNE
jgi:hypothetical protein